MVTEVQQHDERASGSAAGVAEGFQVVGMALGYVTADALYAAASLGIADLLAAGPRHIDELTAATDAHGPSLYRLLRTLCSAGVFAQDEQRHFALTPLGQTLRSDVPGSIRDAVIWIGEPMHARSCGEVLSSVMSGRPAFDGIFGTPYFDYQVQNAEAGRIFDRGMACFAGMENAPIAQSYAFPASARVADIGGGQGGFLAEVLKGQPSARGILFDRPAVVQDPRLLEAAGVLDRCELVGGDFFASLPAGADIYVLKRVLHDWDDDACSALLRRCRAVTPAHGRLLVIDAVIPPGNDPHPAKLVDLIMLTALTGRERTEPEFRELLSVAGFRLTQVIPTPSALSIVEAIPA